MPRTPNTECVLCAKPLYRRPNEIVRVRYVACMGCRGKAQSVVGVTEAQRAGLNAGRGKGKGANRRTGYQHREESKQKVSDANRAYWAANPDKAKERGAKNRDENAYNWKGGITKLSVSIRAMQEMRKWQESVKARDGRCVRCGSTSNLEAHHVRSFADLLRDLAIKSRDDARRHAVILFDLSIGETLCILCHYAEHGRNVPTHESREQKFRKCPQCDKTFTTKPSCKNKCCSRKCSIEWRRSHPLSGEANPNYKGGLVDLICPACQTLFQVKQAEVSKRKYCSRRCLGESQRKRV